MKLLHVGLAAWPVLASAAILQRTHRDLNGTNGGGDGEFPSLGHVDVSMSDILSSARWPERAAFDQSFAAAVSGGAASACTAPLLARARLSPYGFGAHLNQFANEVVLAMYAGKPLALCAPPGVRDEWALYFQDPGFGRCDSCDWAQGPRVFKEMGWDVNDGPDHTRMAEVKRFVYAKLFALQGAAQVAVDEGLSSLGLDGDRVYVGVHIRRGDKVNEVPAVPTSRYAAAISDMCSTAGTSTVFLASDDETVHKELQEQLGSSFQVVEQPRLLADAYALRGAASRSLTPPFGEEEEEKSVLVDVMALVRSAGFVGTASSNIDRLVYFLRDPAKPSLSLDEGGNAGFVMLAGPR